MIMNISTTAHPLKFFISQTARRKIRAASRLAKAFIPGCPGVLPDFIIVGAQKCGTTSLYNYLTQHPSIYPATQKEVGFFSQPNGKSARWYRSHFPSSFFKYWIEKVLGQKFATGEADPAYILDPYALKGISGLIPRVKLIAILRNPVDRAYSHYHHTVRMGKETLSFEDAIEAEPKRVANEWQKMLKGDPYDGGVIYKYSYLLSGIYVTQIEAMIGLFSRDQILILEIKDFTLRNNVAFQRVINFLELPEWQLKNYRKYNENTYHNMDTMDAGLRKELVEYFRPYNQRLYELTGVFDWDR